MAKGIVYITTTAVSGLVKIGKTETKNFQERMRSLEFNGYYNVAGLKRFFAIELEDYNEKEALLHELFSKHRVGKSELFALDQDLAKQLLLSFQGKVIYPEHLNQDKAFEDVAQSRSQSSRFSFYLKGIQDGEYIEFIKDKSITAKVCGEREVEFEGQTWLLSPLTYKIYESRNEQNDSGAYQGAKHWKHKGKRLWALPNVNQLT